MTWGRAALGMAAMLCSAAAVQQALPVRDRRRKSAALPGPAATEGAQMHS